MAIVDQQHVVEQLSPDTAYDRSATAFVSGGRTAARITRVNGRLVGAHVQDRWRV
jgi:hypothetical protein